MNPTTLSEQQVIPRQTERRGGKTVPYTKMYPLVRGGICDKCGVIDKNLESIDQYKLCEHFRGVQLACSYCDPTKNQDEVTRISVLKVHDHPYDKDHQGRPNLVVVCDSYECATKHGNRFDVTA